MRGSIVLMAAMVACGAAAELCAAPPEAGDPVVATVGSRRITAQELERRSVDRLIELRTREHAIRLRVLGELVDEELLAQEASRRGLTVDDLVRREIDAKTVPVRPWDREVYLERERKRMDGLSREEALARADRALKEERLAQRRAGFVAHLRTLAGVTTVLPLPRVVLDPVDAAARGPERAPVTVVAFSDFQCPFCARAAPVLRRLERAYPGKLRFVYRHQPLPSHPQARRAAEAAECAREQGRFWEMHDRLFETQDRLGDSDLRARAADIGLDRGAFDACLASGRTAARWERDLAASRRYGLTGAPAFFINGRLLAGAAPYGEFARIVEEELGSKPGAP
jgi:protein-disulfide isomerase